MFCRHCGEECPPRASYCPRCGRAVDAAPGAAPAAAYVDSTASTIQNYLVLAIFSTALCCLPFGIPAIVFAVQARTRHQLGDRDAAEEALSKARIWSWLSFGFGALIPLVYLTTIVLALFMDP